MEKVFAVFRLFLVLLVILACVAAMGWIWAEDQLPKIASNTYGPPDPALSFVQRIVYSARVMANEDSLLKPVDPQGSPRPFSVTLGESVNSIATRLEEERFIPNADSFRTYLIYAGLDTGVQAGKYELSPAMTPVEIARSLQDSVPAEVEFHILPGWRAEEIAAALPSSGINVSPQDFLQLVRNPPDDLLPDGIPPLSNLEGFLLPGEYQIRRTASARDLAATFLQRFQETITPEMQEGFTAQGLSLPEAVTLASIVQREAVVDEEQPMIASVFYNRLNAGMKLDSDPTVQYAVGYQLADQTWWKNPLSRRDLAVDSRYNTYIYLGLPPGPISNPGVSALRAVAYPAQTNYFYFRAKCDCSLRHAFSVTYEEHLQNACP